MKWWQDAVFYQIYPRSFGAAKTLDGTGDLTGITCRLDYLSDLGIDALWICPVFQSPQVDHGYDVSDYRAIDPIFGSLRDLDDLVAQAHLRGIKVVLDVVPSHTSNQHEWFENAINHGPGSAARHRYLFLDGTEPPTDVQSSFGGSAWTRVTEADGSAGQWYFHMHDAHQPDLNWAEPSVLEDFEGIYAFWLDRGIDGFRIDVADHLTKDVSRNDVATGKELLEHGSKSRTHEVLRSLRTLADSYPRDIALVGEVGAEGPELELYVRPDELPMVFNFPFMHAGWNAERLRQTINDALRLRELTGVTPTWVTDSHDEPRSPSRYSSDRRRGARRARAMALVLLSLPGVPFIYQGQELGLPNVDDIPEELLQDPIWERSGHTNRGRDGCRVPLPWSGNAPAFGFFGAQVRPSSPRRRTAKPWLPQPPWFADYAVSAQLENDDSNLALFARLLALRREHVGLRRGTLTWLESTNEVLAFERQCDSDVISVIVNLSDHDVPLPPGEIVARSWSGPDADGKLAPDSAVWIRPAALDRSPAVAKT